MILYSYWLSELNMKHQTRLERVLQRETKGYAVEGEVEFYMETWNLEVCIEKEAFAGGGRWPLPETKQKLN